MTKLEELKRKADRLMRMLPGDITTMWLFLGGDKLPEDQGKELWEHIEYWKDR